MIKVGSDINGITLEEGSFKRKSLFLIWALKYLKILKFLKKILKYLFEFCFMRLKWLVVNQVPLISWLKVSLLQKMIWGWKSKWLFEWKRLKYTKLCGDESLNKMLKVSKNYIKEICFFFQTEVMNIIETRNKTELYCIWGGGGLP